MSKNEKKLIMGMLIKDVMKNSPRPHGISIADARSAYDKKNPEPKPEGFPSKVLFPN